MRRVIAAISDMHFGPASARSARYTHEADRLLGLAAKRINDDIRPDLVMILGDCIDLPCAVSTDADLCRMVEVVRMVKPPCVVIPGNHDPQVERFYAVMPRPADVVDVAGVRVLPLIDPEMPRYNARRDEANLKRTRDARADGFTGPVIAVQHVPLWPWFEDRVWFNYTNHAEAVDALIAGGVTLSIGGHCHAANGPMVHRGCRFMTVPPLCEPPFAFTVVTIDGDAVEARAEILAPLPW